MCQVDSAVDFAEAKHLLSRRSYGAAILDIMGVNGHGMLEIAIENKIPALILTAHALSAENFKKPIKGGAHAYLPKDKMIDIQEYLAELISSEWIFLRAWLFWQWFSTPFRDETPFTG